MTVSDPWGDPDAQADATLQAMVTRLEERGRHVDFARMIRTYVDTLPTDRPLRVLEIGCGTGVVTRQLAAALHPASIIRGADISAGLLTEARRLATPGAIHWDHLLAGPLPYEDATFDAVLMHTVLGHVPDPLTLLAQSARVLRPGGRLILFDADHAGTTYAQADYPTTRRFDFALTSAIAVNPAICRQMPRLLKEAQLQLEGHRADVIAECGRGDFWLSSVRGIQRMLPTLRVLAPEDAQRWVRHMLASHDEGTFFAAGAFYTFYASKR